MEKLSEGLDPGATIYVIGMVDVPRLYDVAKDKKALGIVDCEVLWFFTLFELFPCGTVLGPYRTEEDRIEMTQRIEGFNKILQDLITEFRLSDPSHYYYYSNAVFEYSNDGFVESHVSDLDCFHPSTDGQWELSRVTWQAADGPGFYNW